MSRIGRKPMEIPEGVEIALDRNSIRVKGQKGELILNYHHRVNIVKENSILRVEIKLSDKFTRSLYGLTRSLVANMIEGVTKGYEKKLEIIGIGYRAQLQGTDLILHVGYSHPVIIKVPKGIEFKLQKNIITVSGIDKQLVGEIAAKIRKVRKPEPYKGKGIRYLGEFVKRKAGKAAKGGAVGSS